MFRVGDQAMFIELVFKNLLPVAGGQSYLAQPQMPPSMSLPGYTHLNSRAPFGIQIEKKSVVIQQTTYTH
jgi:hypothetical protein